MPYFTKQLTYSARRCRSYSRPNAAEPGYFAGKILDVLTAAATCMGTVTLLLYFMTF